MSVARVMSRLRREKDQVAARTHVVDYSIQAPAAAHERMYDLDPTGRTGSG